MGKRSDFSRIERDYYPTPIEAVRPLVPHLHRAKFWYTEPCAGDGRLVRHLGDLTQGNARAEYVCDLAPQIPEVEQFDAMCIQAASMFITNPPDLKAPVCPDITEDQWPAIAAILTQTTPAAE